jgi:hypothetical protein
VSDEQEQQPTPLEQIVAAQAEQLAEMKRLLEEQNAAVIAAQSAAKRQAKDAYIGRINGGLVDDTVMALVPDVDATTDEGKAQLRSWAQTHPSLFRGTSQPAGQQPQSPTHSGAKLRSFAEIIGGRR